MTSHQTAAKERIMARPVVHWELWSHAPETVSKFYADVFDWQIQHMPEIDYRMVQPGEGGIGGGIFKPEEGPWPGNMALYIDVDDLAAYRAKIVQAGGKIIVEKMDVPGAGSFSLFEDTDGRVMGLWQRAAQP
jgi:uncharacterized protein